MEDRMNFPLRWNMKTDVTFGPGRDEHRLKGLAEGSVSL